MVDNPRSFVSGIVEGMVAPLLELLSSLLFSASLKVSESASGPTWYLGTIVVIVIIADFVRNVLLGVSRSQFALGNIFGNIAGLFIFFGVINSISKEAASESLLLTIALIASYGLGVYIYWRRRQ